MRFLRFGTEGFLAVCRVPPGRQPALVRVLRRHYRHAPIPGIRVAAEGKSLIRIQGGWFDPGSPRLERIRRTFRRLRSLELSRQLYSPRPPVLSDDSIRFTVIAETPALRWLQRTLEGVHIEYRIHRVQPLEKEATSPLETLTNPQRNTFLLAHSLGYYDVPRRTDTGHLAQELNLNRGTVGRHLRRAEKHIVEWVVTQPPR